MNKINENDYLIKLGMKIQGLREAAGISREELAEAIGTTRMQIYRIETGIKRNSPTILMLLRISQRCNISLNHLVKID